MAHKPADKTHYGWKLSRACIRDTLMMKREHLLTRSGLGRALYSSNIRALRETQLAPYEETMTAGRYLAKQTLKRMPHDVVIVVRRGFVEEVRSNNPFLSVYIADYDSDDPDRDTTDLEEAEERGTMPDMHIIY